MVKKSIFFVGVLVLGFAGIGFPNSLVANSTILFQLDEISQAEKILVCCELVDKRIMDLRTALLMVEAGTITITKINSGVYQVVYPGGLLIVELETGNL